MMGSADLNPKVESKVPAGGVRQSHSVHCVGSVVASLLCALRLGD